MATENIGRVLRNPGRLALGPTDLSTAFPHGGTAIGFVRAIAIRSNFVYTDIRAEEWGGEVVESVYQSESWTLAAVVRQWDDDVIQRLYPNTAVGAASGQRVIEGGATVRPGTPVGSTAGMSRSYVVIFTPDDPSNPAVLFRRALLVPDAALELQAEIDRDLELAVVFRAIRPATGRIYQMGVLEDLTL